MDTKDLAGDDGGDRERVEYVDKRFPDLDVCPPFAFVIETVHCGDLVNNSVERFSVNNSVERKGRTSCDVGTLVVAAQEEKVFRILDLVAK